MSKVKTVKVSRFGQSVIIGSKKVAFDNEGIAEVSEDILEEVLKGDEELELVDASKEEGGEDEGKKEYRKQLTAMKKDEVLQLAKEAELPEEEYNTLNKDKLVDYLVSKIS